MKRLLLCYHFDNDVQFLNGRSCLKVPAQSWRQKAFRSVILPVKGNSLIIGFGGTAVVIDDLSIVG